MQKKESMSDTPTISFDAPGIGLVTMIGVGPWKVYNIGHSREIKDSNGQVANPTVVQKFSTTTKPNRNVVFARPAHAEQIVELANAELAKVTK
jgi:hypothetical protein